MASLIGILDSEKENQRLELVLEGDKLALKFSVYSDGLGWQVLKTIHIDAQQAEQMQFLLGGACHLLKQNTTTPINFSAAKSRLQAVKTTQPQTDIRRSA